MLHEPFDYKGRILRLHLNYTSINNGVYQFCLVGGTTLVFVPCDCLSYVSIRHI